ncbi:lysine 2,3-aminomutase [Clostridium brassicae]|uniref:L-lysine 2,3-aminomutase n=1 Tax=Clostridium brassicae TaxID=2999072 RepID=A0ABT4D4K4_9CLOT|nr:lysine 2,3-aminomutase [Clostridium brassicae]MCY6957223.1 lysine 2,3-aminomutase [Clostridium brassicae]
MSEQNEKQNINSINWEEKYSSWKDWKWQINHSVKDIETFEKLLNIKIDEKEKNDIKATMGKFPMSITPYYLSLIDINDYKNDPIYKQAFPSSRELIINKYDMADPLAEDKDSPVEGVTHRYPDRVLLHISNVCAMYCRHCTRKRKVGDIDCIPDKETIKKGIDYIKNTPQVRDVLLSGGDPFLLSDEYLEWILKEVSSIPHVEVIRIGTRTPVVLPYRITDNLVNMLKKYHPLWINTHFNHPREITKSSRNALKKLADAGIPLGNQSVLLAGVNDCPHIMKRLVQKLVQNRVRPYYIYQCDMSEGLSHFRTPIGKGIEIMESLRGHTSGFAIPTFVVDAPGGGGKIPVMPNYLVSWSHNKVILRNYEGVITTYKEPDSYKANLCDLDCDNCNLTLNLDEVEEIKAIGIEKLLCDYDKAISFVPNNNERLERRKNE